MARTLIRVARCRPISRSRSGWSRTILRLGFNVTVAVLILYLSVSARAEQQTAPPLAATKFCLDYPIECKNSNTVKPPVTIILPKEIKIETVNREVNDSIVPVHKSQSDGVIESWRISPLTGDCNDYAVTKRHKLIKKGIPESDLVLTAVKTLDGQDHLVLVVRSDRGDLVLDNLHPEVRPLDQTGYRVEKQQDVRDAKAWIVGKK